MKVGILVFNDVEVLDFAGPYEVFSLSRKENKKLFEVFTIGEKTELIRAVNGLQIIPDYSFEDCPLIDILVVPGGFGARKIEICNKAVIEWIGKQSEKTTIVASVCTGAFLLAEAGLLNNKRVTTHWKHTKELGTTYPLLHVEENVKYIDEGCIITSAGISAGINMSFYIISKLFGTIISQETAKNMEYDIILAS